MITVDGNTDSNTTLDAGQFTLSIDDSLWQAVTQDSITCAPAVGPDGTIYVGSDEMAFTRSIRTVRPGGAFSRAHLSTPPPPQSEATKPSMPPHPSEVRCMPSPGRRVLQRPSGAPPSPDAVVNGPAALGTVSAAEQILDSS